MPKNEAQRSRWTCYEAVNLELVKGGMAEVYKGKSPSGFDTNPYLVAENI
jgi:hypothetical protein